MFRILLSLFFVLALGLRAQDLTYSRTQEGTLIQILVSNAGFTDYSIEFVYEAVNLKSSLRNHGIVVVPKQTENFVISRLEYIDPSQKTHFSYNAYSVQGNVFQHNPDLDYPYALPFKKGTLHKITQGYNGVFSHQNAQALDFDLAENSEVYAAREGIVTDVVTSNDRHCSDSPECADYNNRVVIQHTDGSFAEYVHLKKNGSPLKKGEPVKKNQLIGYSGDTGWTQGPHLHFSVFYNKINSGRIYVPTKFEIVPGATPIFLKKGVLYRKL